MTEELDHRLDGVIAWGRTIQWSLASTPLLLFVVLAAGLADNVRLLVFAMLATVVSLGVFSFAVWRLMALTAEITEDKGCR